MDDTKLSLEEFNPKVAELNELVAKTKNITASDLTDTKQIALVRESRLALKAERVKIEKTGKRLREGAISFQKAVIAHEKGLIAIIEPEEERLEAIETEAKQIALKEERKASLPERRQRLQEVADGAPEGIYMPSDDELLEMNGIQFETFYNAKVAEKNQQISEANARAQREADERAEQERKDAQAKIDAELAEKQRIADAEIAEKKRKADEEQAKIDAENARIKAEQDARDAELKAEAERIEAEKQRIEQERIDRENAEKAEADRKAKEEADEIARVDAENAERQRKEEAEQAERDRVQKQQAFRDWLASFGWSDETKSEFKITETADGYIIYKKLGTYIK